MLTKAKRFFRNPIYLLAVVVSLAVVGVGSAFAISVFADGAPEGWEQEDADAITTRNPYVLYLDEGDYGDHVDVSFDVTRHLEQSSTDYKQINGYTERTESTYYGVKARVSGTKAAYYWYDENGTQQSVNGKSDLLSYLPNEYTVNKVWNEAPIDSNAKVWLYATKSVDAYSSDGVTDKINISFCCASIPIDVYKSRIIGSDGSKKLNQSFDTRYSAATVRSYCSSQDGYTTYTFDKADANWGCEDTMQAYRYDIGNYRFDANESGVSYSLVLGGSTDEPPILGIVRNNPTVNAGLWGYYTSAIIAAYAPNYEYTVPITSDRSISAEPATVEGTTGDTSDLTYSEYKSFTLKKSPAGGFYYTEDTGIAEIPYAESLQDNYTTNESDTDIPDEVGETVNLYSVADPTKLLRSQTVSKIYQSYSTWTEVVNERTFTVTGKVKNEDGNVISTFTQPAGQVYDNDYDTLGFMHITADSGSFEFHDNTAGNLLTIKGIGSSGGLSAKMGVKVHYDMSPLKDNYAHVQYAANSGYVSSDHEYALENPVGDGDGRADIISTNYGGISTFIDQGSPYMNADDGLFDRTVKLSGTSDANKAPMYSANGIDYQMIDAWQLTNEDSDIFWPISGNATVNVTVEELLKSLSGRSGYDDADVYDNAQGIFEFDPSTGLFLYTFTVQPKVGKTVSYVAEYTDSNDVTHTFPLRSEYQPNIHTPGDTVTVKDKLNIGGWTFEGWEIDTSSLPSGTTLADITGIVTDGDGKVTSFTMPNCNVVLKGILTPPNTVYTLTYDTNYQDDSTGHNGAYDLGSVIPTVPKNSADEEAPTQTFRLSDCTPVFDCHDDSEGTDYFYYEYTFPTRTTTAESYRFGGWQEESYYGSPVQKINIHDITQEEYTVYAIWLGTVTYKPNYTGATQPDVVDTRDLGDSVDVREGDTFTPPARATFRCWNTKADGTGNNYDYYSNYGDSSFCFSDLGGEVTLYAQWDWDAFRLAYDDNTDATVNNMPADVDAVYYNELNAAGGYALSTQVPTRTDGVGFLGWYLDSAGTGSPVTAVTYAQAVAQKGSELNAGDTVTLYAKWGTPSVSLQYEANTTDEVGNMPEQNPVTDLSPDSFKVAGGYTLSTEIPTRTGYRFGGWYLDAGCTGSPVTAVTYEQASEQKGSDIINGDTVYVYAKWNSWTYRVEYRPGTGHEGASNMPVGRNTDGTEDTSSHVQCFLYGDVHPTSHVTVSTVQPTDEGYTFTGWNVEKAEGISKIYTVAELNDSNVSKVLNEDDFPDDDDRTIVATAQWEKNTYTVTYHPNEGTGDEFSESVEHGASHTVLANTDEHLGYIRDGYEFSGWNTAADGSGTSYAAGSTISGITANVDLYAQWDKLYTLKFDLDGGTSSTIPASKELCRI